MSLPVGLSFVRTINGKYMTVVDEFQCRRYLCFTTLKTATKCIDYCAEFRSKHGYWPEIDLSKTKNEINTIEFKSRSPEQLKKFFEIDFHNGKEVDDVCSVYDVPYFVCHDFQYAVGEKDYQLFLTAQALDCDPPQLFESMTKLNKLLDR